MAGEKRKAVIFMQQAREFIVRDVYKTSTYEELRNLVDLHEPCIDRENVQAWRETLREAEVAFSTWGMPGFTEEEIRAFMPNLKAVFYAAGSVQAFARPFLNCGVAVVSAWAANAVPVAEYTMAQILLANKGFYQAAAQTKADYRGAAQYSRSFPGNYAAKVGLIGAGMIGSLVIELLKPFRLEIMVYDPFLSDEKAEQLGVRKYGLREIFEQCQTISNHLANLPATVGMLNGELFDLMLPNATFINTGRGAQVVEADLIRALKAEPGRTALLDVTDPEPSLPDSELLKLDNVIMTPHIAGSMSHEVERMARYMLEEFIRYDAGEPLKYAVTLKMLETMA